MALRPNEQAFILEFRAEIDDVRKQTKELADTTTKATSTWKETAKGVGAAIAGAFAADKIIQFGKDTLNAAKDTQQAIQGTQAIFGDFSNQILDFSKTTAEKFGIARGDFLSLANDAAASLKDAGVPTDQIASRIEGLTKSSADLAAVYGGDVKDAFKAVTDAAAGDTGKMKNYGITIDKNADAIQRMDKIMQSAAPMAGQFAKSQDSGAGAAQTLSAQFTDLQATLGMKLLPVLNDFMQILSAIMAFVSENQGWLTPIIAGIATLVLGIKAWTIAQAALNIVMDANPIGLIIIAVAALIAGVIALYMKVDWFRNFVDAAIDGIVKAFKWLWSFIQDLAQLWWTVFSTVYIKPLMLLWDYIQWLREAIPAAFRVMVDWIKAAFSGVVDIVSVPFKLAWDLITGYFNLLHTLFDNVRGWLYDAFRALENIITAPFKAAFDSIKWLWNHTIGGFGFSVPSWIPGVGGQDFKIPYMATGGIVTRPTIALIGERGAEAVVPLTGNNAMGFGNVTINVYALTANAEVGRRVVEALREYQRTSGGAAIYDVSRVS